MLPLKPMTRAITLALATAPFTLTHAGDWEIAGFVKNETALFTESGQRTGQAEFAGDSAEHDAGEVYKSENTFKLFANKKFGESSSFHAEINLVYDPLAVDGYKDYDAYSQHDYLREFYFDTTVGKTDLRIGKQQVVWGTADGIKLLDIINPTDWREFNQNKMEDSRIPVWMINTTTLIDDTSDVQLIVSQVKENKIPGLTADGDAEQPFLMKGVDTITGKVNGFLNIIPRLTNVATSFTMGATNNMFGKADMNGDQMTDGLVPFSGMSVNLFASLPWAMGADRTLAPSGNPVAPGAVDNVQNFPNFAGNGFVLLNAIAQQGLPTLMQMPGADPYGNHNATNLMTQSGGAWTMAAPTTNTVRWDVKNPQSTFEYMPNASFATFNNSSGNSWLARMMLAPKDQGGMGMRASDLGYASDAQFFAMFHDAAQSEYVRDYPEDTETNFGLRYKKGLKNGFNFSLNYFYGYDSNPAVNLSCRDALTSEPLAHELRRPNAAGQVPNYSDAFAKVIQDDQVNNFYDGTIGVAYNGKRQYYGAFNPMTGSLAAFGDTSHSPNGIVMTLTESLERNHNLGASFDYALDTKALGPVVLRGEFLYKRDEMHPIIDRRLLAIGYLPEALKSQGHDMFKYVLGADITVMTNLMISAQFIQFRNLDFQDQQRTCWTGFAEGQGESFDCSRYTADMPTLHLSNGLQKAQKNKEFVSLFFSKPFGEEQQGRWNNITIAEDTGGFWNRFDIEYSFNDKLIGMFEWNAYWGDEDSMFGQFGKADNVQVGIKYLF